MGKKRRIKKNNQDKQGHHPDDDNPRNISRDFDISSFYDDILHQIIPLLHQLKHQEKEQNPVNISRTTANNNMDPNDFISILPNNILYQIISLLPFESAVRTSLLSTHWKDLWKEVLLDSIRGVTVEAAIAAISSFLEGFDIHHRPRNKWGLRFEWSHGGAILAAISINGALRLDFSAGKQEFPRPFDWSLKLKLKEFPRPFFRSLNHRLYRHTFFTWNPWEDHALDPQENTMRVKYLYLISVHYPFNEAISSLLLSLPFLESLTIANCNGLRSLQIKQAKGLDKLVVLDCPQLQYLSFEGSYLTSFQYRGRLVSFELADSSNGDHAVWSSCSLCTHKLYLNDAMLDFRKGPPIYNTINFDGLKSILESIKGVKSLTLCRWIFEPLISCMLPSLGGNHEYHLYTLMELWWIDCSMGRENFNALLRFLKLCPRLERLYVTIDPESHDMRFRSTKKLSTKVNGQEKLNHLRLVKLEGFANENKEILFEKKLRPLFRKRPLILAKSKGTCTLRRLVKVPDLEKQGKYPYKFKEGKFQVHSIGLSADIFGDIVKDLNNDHKAMFQSLFYGFNSFHHR